MQGLAFVDYDNLCPGNRFETEVEIRTAELLDSLALASQAAFPDLRELDVRLYGGWLDERGVPGPSALWLLPLLPVLRGRWRGLIVRPALATTMLQFPDVELRGTVRLQAKRRRQKWSTPCLAGADNGGPRRAPRHRPADPGVLGGVGGYCSVEQRF